MSQGIEMIAAERARQTARGHDAHDADRLEIDLQEAARAFLMQALSFRFAEINQPELFEHFQGNAIHQWPWLNTKSLSSTTTRKEALIKAGAMIAAQLDKMIKEDVAQ